MSIKFGVSARITDESNNEIAAIKIQNLQELKLRCYVDQDCFSVKINAVRSDFLEEKRTGESEFYQNLNGQNVLDGGFFEGRLTDLDEWINIGKFENSLDLGKIKREEYVEFQIRLNLPSELIAYNYSIYAGLAVRALEEYKTDYYALFSEAIQMRVYAAGLADANGNYVFDDENFWWQHEENEDLIFTISPDFSSAAIMYKSTLTPLYYVEMIPFEIPIMPSQKWVAVNENILPAPIVLTNQNWLQYPQPFPKIPTKNILIEKSTLYPEVNGVYSPISFIIGETETYAYLKKTEDSLHFFIAENDTASIIRIDIEEEEAVVPLLLNSFDGENIPVSEWIDLSENPDTLTIRRA